MWSRDSDSAIKGKITSGFYMDYVKYSVGPEGIEPSTP